MKIKMKVSIGYKSSQPIELYPEEITEYVCLLERVFPGEWEIASIREDLPQVEHPDLYIDPDFEIDED